jgi:anaerobic C4-dicarboxylate transporter
VNAAGQLQMPSMIMMVMLAAAGFIILFANTTAAQVHKAVCLHQPEARLSRYLVWYG